MRLVNFFFVFLVFNLAFALAVTTDKTNYASGENVIISGICLNPNVAVGLQAGIGLNTVWINQVTASASRAFSATFHPTQNGNYTVYAACRNETSSQAAFCVGSQCSTITPTSRETCGNGVCGSGETCSNCTQDCGVCPSGGSGGYRCESSWTCGVWSYCNASLKRSRTCVDNRSCEVASRVEIQICPKCDYSWVCSAWSECQYGEQVRTCRDEHNCGVTEGTPQLRRACQAATVPPAYVPPAYVPPPEPPKPIVKPAPQPSFFEKYIYYILGLIAFIVLAVIALFTIYLIKSKHQVYDISELKEWIRKEREMGTSDEQIRQILSQNTGWGNKEIEQAFGELKQ